MGGVAGSYRGAAYREQANARCAHEFEREDGARGHVADGAMRRDVMRLMAFLKRGQRAMRAREAGSRDRAGGVAR